MIVGTRIPPSNDVPFPCFNGYELPACDPYVSHGPLSLVNIIYVVSIIPSD